MNPFSLEGETALITGGGTGLGLGMATAMAAAGAKVVLVGRREVELAAAVTAIGPTAFALPHDVNDVDAAPRVIADAARLAGSPVTILVNNAGQHLRKPAHETTASEFNALLHTHVLAAHALCAAVLPGMFERGHGSILFTASMASLFGIPNVIAYSTAKSAYLGMVRGLATEVSPRGVRVNAIAPGWIVSAITERVFAADPARKAKILARTPMNRLGDAQDIGHAAVYLSSPAAKFVTGVILPVDGGASIGF